jgi:hypothetical protein
VVNARGVSAAIAIPFPQNCTVSEVTFPSLALFPHWLSDYRAAAGFGAMSLSRNSNRWRWPGALQNCAQLTRMRIIFGLDTAVQLCENAVNLSAVARQDHQPCTISAKPMEWRAP